MVFCSQIFVITGNNRKYTERKKDKNRKEIGKTWHKSTMSAFRSGTAWLDVFNNAETQEAYSKFSDELPVF